MISPFLAMSSARQTNGSNTSPLTGNAAEALSEHVMAPPGQRARLNPPPYSASVEPGPSVAATTSARGVSVKKQKERNGSMSGATAFSGHSRTSTRESVTVYAGPRTEQSRTRAGTVVSVVSVVSASGGGGVEMTHG